MIEIFKLVVYTQTEVPSPILLRTKVTLLDWNTCKDIYGKELTGRMICSFDNNVGPCMVSGVATRQIRIFMGRGHCPNSSKIQILCGFQLGVSNQILN